MNIGFSRFYRSYIMNFAIPSPNLLKLSLAALLTLGGLSACYSTPTQTVAPDPAPTTSALPGMDHSKMDHSKMDPGTMNSPAMGHHLDLGPADADFDRRFVDGMVPHHQGAVVMAKEVLQKSSRPELKKFANDILQAQAAEIAQMKQWRQAWYPQADATLMAYDAKQGKMMPMSAEQQQGMMMSVDLGAADEQFDLRFINAMIPHHEGAITMAKAALQKSNRPEMKKLAQAIITSQQTEINQMNQWRKAWYNQ
jgi:uncharacterized protein (DUF305 family)